MIPSEQAVLAALQREHLLPFVGKGFELLHPGQPFLLSKHVMAICNALERVAKGEVQRLLITVPPRHGKSICTSVCLPAWLLGQQPAMKIIVTSYGGDLANKHARDFRSIVTSGFYRRLFPGMQLASDRLDEQITTRNGGRKALSLGGAATGFGADVIIVDDLIKAADANSDVERQRALDYYQQTLLSRLDNKGLGRIIVIQQRLHEYDLPGFLLEQGQFEHLNLPAIAVADTDIAIGFSKQWHRKKGEALYPEREPLQVLAKLREEMGPAVFSAQYQQDPTPPGGNRFRWEWFSTYGEQFTRDDFQFVVQSWDTALSAEPDKDFSVGTTWGFREGQWLLLDLVRERLDFPDLKRRVSGAARKWRANKVIVEGMASGLPLVQQLRLDDRQQPWRYEIVKPALGKVERFEAQTARFETGKYLIPSKSAWLEEFRRELLAFPKGKHDDQVDSIVQFVEWEASRRGRALINTDPVTGRPVHNSRPAARLG